MVMNNVPNGMIRYTVGKISTRGSTVPRLWLTTKRTQKMTSKKLV